jgi:hypothetical protein
LKKRKICLAKTKKATIFVAQYRESSSVGRASAFQAECRRFEPGISLKSAIFKWRFFFDTKLPMHGYTLKVILYFFPNSQRPTVCPQRRIFKGHLKEKQELTTRIPVQ